MTLTLRLPNGHNVISCGIYYGAVFFWIGRAVGQHRSVSFILNDDSPSQTGPGRWSW